MSFTEMLKNAREKVSSNKKQDDTTANIKEDNNNNIPVVEENKTDNKPDTSFITLGDAIIKQANDAKVKYKNLKGTGAAKRINRALQTKNIKVSQLNKAFKIQERFNDKRADYHLVGGYALQRLRMLLSQGVRLNDALNSKYTKD